MTNLPWSLRKRTVSPIIARFSSGVVRRTSLTCSSQVLPKIVTTGVSRFEQQPDLVVALDRDALAAGRAERRQARVLELPALGLGKELDVLGIGPRPAAFDVMNPERVELLGDAQLVHHRKVDAFALAAVAQGRIVDFDFGFHKHPRQEREGISTLSPPGCKVQKQAGPL